MLHITLNLILVNNHRFSAYICMSFKLMCGFVRTCTVVLSLLFTHTLQIYLEIYLTKSH